MKKSTQFHFPPKSTLSYYDTNDLCFHTTKNRQTDMSDFLMQKWPKPTRTVIFGLKVDSKKWAEWNDETLGIIENLIRDDLGFDGFRVCITRLFGEGSFCETEARWKLSIEST